MLEQLLTLDKALFHLVNSTWTHPFFDSILPWARNKFLWAPLYLFIGSFFVLNFRQRGLYAMLYLGMVVLFCDQISSDVIKPLVGRLRPCNELTLADSIRLLAGCGKSYSFTSSHAANHFGVATFLGIVLWQYSRIILPIAFLWAAIVGYAQVYVGAHYPLDVVGGALVGIAVGTGVTMLYKRHFRTLSH